MALSDPHPPFSADTSAESAKLNAKLTALFDALGDNTYPSGVNVTTDESFTDHVRNLDTELASIAGHASHLGYRVGMGVSQKDNDEFYVGSGGLEIGGNIYTVASQITKAVSTSEGTDHTEYVYIDPPASGNALSADDVEYSTTAPVFSDSLQGYYHPTNTDWRCIGTLTFDASNALTGAATYPASECSPRPRG